MLFRRRSDDDYLSDIVESEEFKKAMERMPVPEQARVLGVLQGWLRQVRQKGGIADDFDINEDPSDGSDIKLDSVKPSDVAVYRLKYQSAIHPRAYITGRVRKRPWIVAVALSKKREYLYVVEYTAID